MNKTGRWSYNDCGNEYWNNDDYETQDDAINAAFADEDFVKENACKDERGNYMLPIATGQLKQPTICDGIDLADCIIETIAEHHSDNYGEYCDYYLDDVTKEQQAELYETINKAVEEWATKHSLQPTHYLIENTEEDEYFIEDSDALKWAKESVGEKSV